ncbi:MAG: hypothetical protein AAGC68_07135 [Verrucomicrobiota bacterium]
MVSRATSVAIRQWLAIGGVFGFLVVSIACGSDRDVRTWTSVDAKTLRASLESATESTVILRLESGR